MGQLLDVATDDEARLMFADLPLPVRVLWRVAGKRQYRRHVERVRGKPLNPLLRCAFKAADLVMVRDYRRSQGRRGARAKGLPVLLITAPGRRTGTEHTTKVVYLEFGGSYLVCGTAGGAPLEPQWFGNLRRVDRASVQIGAETHPVAVRVPNRVERNRLWEEVLARAPFFAKYEQKAGRLIPVALLTPSAEPG